MAAELSLSKLNPENHLLLEQPLLKVPYELARRNFKTVQRHVERERDYCLSTLKSTAASCRSANVQPSPSQNGHGGQATKATTLESLDSMIHRMENLKRKLQVLHAEERGNHKATRARIVHLQDMHEIPSQADVKYDEWSKIRLNRLLVDYLLRMGYASSARDFARATNIEDLVDVDAFVQCSKIEKSLSEGRTAEALAWCSENKQNLKRMGSTLEFELRLQQYIELVRTGQGVKLLEAALHAKKHLTGQPQNEEGQKTAIQAAGLLAYPPGTLFEPYKTLYSQTRWTHLTALFTRTHHSLLSLPTSPALHVALQAGLSALKTPACHSIHASSSGNVSTATSGTSVCPICSTELNELARSVPYAHHTTSHIEDDPVVMPNGRIYGRERLTRLNEKMVTPEIEGLAQLIMQGGPVRDPMNPDEIYDWREVKKVYIS